MKIAIPFLLLVAGCSWPGPPEGLAPRPAAFLDADILESLPHVHKVHFSLASEEPKRQIVHILNWHYLAPEAFYADGGEDWVAFLDDVEAVQVEQMALLRALAKSHGLKQVFLEGIAQDGMPSFRNLIGYLSRWKKPESEDSIQEFVNELVIGMHDHDVLMVGAAGRLMMSGELEVLPSEDAEAMDAANPVKDGKVKYIEAANERREDAIVRNVLASEPSVAVLILGGGHNLSDNVERLGAGQVEYVRVQVEAHRKAAGE